VFVYFLQQGEKVLSTFEFMHCGDLTTDEGCYKVNPSDRELGSD